LTVVIVPRALSLRAQRSNPCFRTTIRDPERWIASLRSQ
jgi:hypothetical protein